MMGKYKKVFKKINQNLNNRSKRYYNRKIKLLSKNNKTTVEEQ